jgi:hypothetical protein
MAQVIKLKRGTTTPTTSNIANGEVAVDTSAQKLYINDGGIVKEIAPETHSTQNYAVTTGDTFTGSVTFNDNAKIQVGTGADYTIFHDGSNTYLEDQGTGSVFFKSNGAGYVFRSSNDNNLLSMLTGSGETKLFYAGGASSAEKLSTKSTGVNVTGVTETDQLRVTNSNVPSSASDTGTAGDIAIDANYIYVCTAANTWKRVAISTWT